MQPTGLSLELRLGATRLLIKPSCISLTKPTCHPAHPLDLQIILHPRWGSSVYPASMFAKAPLEAVRQAIDEAVAELKDRL